MKKTLLTICAVLMVSSYLLAQNLTYTYDASKSGNGAPLVGETSVYCHSGGTDQPGAIVGATDIWTYVVGNWGSDDGVGKMTDMGNNMWQLDLGDAVTYYSQAGNGPVPGAAVLRVGMVFRNANGSIGGKDVNDADIFGDLQGASPVVYNSDGTTFDGVVISVNTGINEIGNASFAATVYPNPVSDESMFAYTLNQSSKNISVRVFNQVGQQVNLYNRYNQGAGTYLIHFNAADLSNGLYNYVFNVDGVTKGGKFFVTK